MILSGRRLLRVALGSHISGNMAFQSRHFAMVTENVPALGESITEGAIAEWNKVVGEAVSIDDVVCTVETDKVTVEIRSPIAGVLAEQMAAVDDTVSFTPPPDLEEVLSEPSVHRLSNICPPFLYYTCLDHGRWGFILS
jgi:hypothetical protein